VGSHWFVTVDAETEVIEDGIRTISELRDEVEEREGISIPLVWFVRFQRDWDDYVLNDSAAAFEGPPVDGYDGFALAGSALSDLLGRGDEIGWHYHAYNYVHRDDLSHETRLEILRADLASCAGELRRRYPEFPVRSFRFGWCFVPDYSLYDDLARLGIVHDASIHPERGGQPVADFAVRYPRPLVTVPSRIGRLVLFPRSRTLIIHDWTVVPHDLGWNRFDEDEAVANRQAFVRDLEATAARLKRDGGEFLTYATAPPSMIAEAVDA
jgi:hypothetical protein